jgi:hypothetical protein
MDVAQSRHVLGCQRAGSNARKLNTTCRLTVEDIAGESLGHLDSDVPLRFFSSTPRILYEV